VSQRLPSLDKWNAANRGAAAKQPDQIIAPCRRIPATHAAENGLGGRLGGIQSIHVHCLIKDHLVE
jgi:hypothetical protein